MEASYTVPAKTTTRRGRRGTFTTELRRRGGCGNPSETEWVKGTTAATVVNDEERVRMERDRTCEDDDRGRRVTFTTGLRRRGGCGNPSQKSGVSREQDAAEEENEKRGSGWRSSPVPAKTTMGGGEGAARWVRENPSEV